MTLRRHNKKTSGMAFKMPETPLQPRSGAFELSPTMTMHDLRSLSRGQHQLRTQLFKSNSKNAHNQDYLSSVNPKQLLKSYSSFGTLPNEQERPKFNARQFLGQKNALLATNQKRATEKTEPRRTQKREFKLIHQIKREKAIKMEEKIKASSKQIQQSSSKLAIEAGSHSKMGAFAEELHLILEPQTEPKRSIRSQVTNAADLLQPGVSLIKQQHKKEEMEQQSCVKMSLPSELLRSQEYSTLKKESNDEYRAPDLSRSFSIAERLLKQRKGSVSSMDVSLRESKVRAEISISLALESRQTSRIDLSAFYKDLQGRNARKELVSCRDKVNAHLEILQSMSTFVYESTSFDEIGEEWEELNFLIFKKFYIERRKVLNFIQKYPMRNPFCVYKAEITSKEVIQFMKTEEGGALLTDLQRETKQLKEKVAKIYSRFGKEKVGEKINTYEYDNFSHWIIEELWAQLILTEHNPSHSREKINIRLCRILQLIFLISELNGKYECSFEEAEAVIAEQDYGVYVREGKEIFERYILYKNEESERQ